MPLTKLHGSQIQDASIPDTALVNAPGDMLKADYDPDENNVVELAEVAQAVDYDDITNKPGGLPEMVTGTLLPNTTTPVVLEAVAGVGQLSGKAYMKRGNTRFEWATFELLVDGSTVYVTLLDKGGPDGTLCGCTEITGDINAGNLRLQFEMDNSDADNTQVKVVYGALAPFA